MMRVLCALFVVFGGTAVGQTAGYRPQVGQYHPDFVLPRIDNQEAVRLSDYRGRKVLLIHFASW